MDEGHLNGDVEAIEKKMDKCLSINEGDTMEVYHRYIQKGKDVARQGDMNKALELFKIAESIQHSEKLQKRIEKIEELLAQNNSGEEDDDEFVDVNNSGLKLYKDLYLKLYDYQRDGVAFLYSLYRDERKGGILADDMGLGKTIQVISFLSGMYDCELVKHTLLVMPTSLIRNWTKEFTKWTPGIRVKEFHGAKLERTKNLEKVQRSKGVIITTYTMLMNNWQQLSTYEGNEFKWDYVILDEAHKIKTTTTKTAKSVSAVPSKNRVLLTGTPVQNNLREMWSLFHFACSGTLLGTAKTFKMQYENPITRAREKDATPGEMALGSSMSANLMTIIKPYFLRRTKAEVQNRKNEDSGQNKCQGKKQLEDPKVSGAIMPALTRKNDLIVWTYLSRVQEDIYWKFISLDHIKELLMTTRSPLAELTLLKKLCDHPRLLSARAITNLGLKDSPAKKQQSDDTEMGSIINVPDKTLISESGKLVFLFALLEHLREEGHRTLVFAHYRMVLDIIERILKNRGYKVLRLDGTITQVTERERLITLFQTNQTYSVFLLTTQVGGVGITLTAADRVVIFDPSWNPATDAQAVDRAYRIGQTENVVIYRLITCGTVEEKIYRRQVFKDSLIRQNTGDKKNPFRYFSKQELKELFTLEDTRASSTQQLLQSLHSKHRHTDTQLDHHIARLHTMEMFGISDHDLMFSLNVDHDEAPKNKKEQNYIEGRVQKAHELVKAESDLQMQFATNVESSTEPANKERLPENKPGKPRANSVSSPRRPADLDKSGSSKNGGTKSSTIDLTVSDSESGEKTLNLLEQSSLKQKSLSTEDMFGSLSLKEQESFGAADPGDVKAGGTDEKFSQEVEKSPSMLMEDNEDCNLDESQVKSFQKKRLSVFQSSSTSLKVDSWSRTSVGSEMVDDNFNLQLEESDVSYRSIMEDEERKLLSQLQTEGAFDVDKSLTEGQQSAKSQVSEMDESIIIYSKKKRAAVLSDSEEEVEGDDRPQLTMGSVNKSLQMLGSSTPKSGTPSSTLSKSRKSVGGNTSVASRRSLLNSIIKDVDKQDEDNRDELSGRYSDEAEEEEEDYVTSQEDLSLDQTTGETLNTEEERGDLEESTSELELSSFERMEQCTTDAAAGSALKSSSDPENMYGSQGTRGHQFFRNGKLN
ncbi:DNA excision repair protein ERCC-6-like [Nerophis ophidion]|uniref:DNA excision repair protein ERCC-6-like n=1 Tax=Nerophis ophidion TaxID=159077 RepID=UPI002AE0313A|nr:DNA excision repair protein ERCC-6-like [Nerophis ophidion]